MTDSQRYRSHTCAVLRPEHVGSAVKLAGWVHRKRDHGGVLFVDLRDHYGITQIVADSDSPALAILEQVRVESVVTIDGSVKARSAGTVNANLATGEIEVFARGATPADAATAALTAMGCTVTPPPPDDAARQCAFGRLAGYAAQQAAIHADIIPNPAAQPPQPVIRRRHVVQSQILHVKKLPAPADAALRDQIGIFACPLQPRRPARRGPEICDHLDAVRVAQADPLFEARAAVVEAALARPPIVRSRREIGPTARLPTEGFLDIHVTRAVARDVRGEILLAPEPRDEAAALNRRFPDRKTHQEKFARRVRGLAVHQHAHARFVAELAFAGGGPSWPGVANPLA